jgi:hypothetical protein
MNASPAPISLTAPAPPAPVFTLSSALRWLGHDCPEHRCCEAIATLNASVWFIRRGPQFRPSPMETLVLLDLTETGEPPAHIDRIIHEVNCCTRGEAIHVRQRHSSENRHGLIALAWRCHPASRFPDPTIQNAELTEDYIRDLRQAAAKNPSLEQLSPHGLKRRGRKLIRVNNRSQTPHA